MHVYVFLYFPEVGGNSRSDKTETGAELDNIYSYFLYKFVLGKKKPHKSDVMLRFKEKDGLKKSELQKWKKGSVKINSGKSFSGRENMKKKNLIIGLRQLG